MVYIVTSSGGLRNLERGGSGMAENFWVATPTSGHMNAFMTHVSDLSIEVLSTDW